MIPTSILEAPLRPSQCCWCSFLLWDFSCSSQPPLERSYCLLSKKLFPMSSPISFRALFSLQRKRSPLFLALVPLRRANAFFFHLFLWFHVLVFPFFRRPGFLFLPFILKFQLTHSATTLRHSSPWHSLLSLGCLLFRGRARSFTGGFFPFPAFLDYDNWVFFFLLFFFGRPVGPRQVGFLFFFSCGEVFPPPPAVGRCSTFFAPLFFCGNSAARPSPALPLPF